MKLEHIAVWTRDIERLAAFWRAAFGGTVGPLYESRNQVGFHSRPAAENRIGTRVAAGEAVVDAAVIRLAARLVAPPRWTGDGYYEAIIRDPDGNLIELTA